MCKLAQYDREKTRKTSKLKQKNTGNPHTNADQNKNFQHHFCLVYVFITYQEKALKKLDQPLWDFKVRSPMYVCRLALNIKPGQTPSAVTPH